MEEGKTGGNNTAVFIVYGAALGFGILYTFCMYQNPNGITYPVMIVSVYGVLFWMLKRLSIEWKRGSWFLASALVLLGIAACRTADSLLIMMIKTAEFLLAVIFVMHQFYDDREWSIGKYLSSMAVYLCCVIAAAVYPFFQGKEFFRKANLKKYKTVSKVALGLAAALPILLAAGFFAGAGGCGVWCYCCSLAGKDSECMDHSYYDSHDGIWDFWRLLSDLWSVHGSDIR